MDSRKVTLAETIVINSSRAGSVDIPMNGIINKMRCRIIGTYTGIDGNLAAEFPFNILRNLSVKTSKGHFPYSLPSKDLRIMNYLDKKGQVVSSAASGSFEMNLVLDRGELLAIKEDSLPKPLDHPALPFGGLNLAVTWATDADCGTSIAITAATLEVELEETPVTKEQLQAIYGLKLQKYQLPQVKVIGDVDITTNTAPTKSIQPESLDLKKRTIVVTSNTSSVRSSAIATKIQLKNKKVGFEQLPIDRTFITMQNEDREQYDISTILAGVASIDYPTEITNDPWGLRGWQIGDSNLELHTLNSTNGKLRIIEESKLVNVVAFESGDRL